MIDLTYDKALAFLREVVAQAGRDYVYEKSEGMSCLYVIDGKPSCGIGRALHAAGIDIGTLESFDVDGSSLATHAMNRLHRVGVINTDEKAIRLYQEFQYEQDNYVRWGGALDFALMVAAEIE